MISEELSLIFSQGYQPDRKKNQSHSFLDVFDMKLFSTPQLKKKKKKKKKEYSRVIIFPAPCDYFLLSKIKTHLLSSRLWTVENMQHTSQLKTVPFDDFQDCFKE